LNHAMPDLLMAEAKPLLLKRNANHFLFCDQAPDFDSADSISDGGLQVNPWGSHGGRGDGAGDDRPRG